MDDTIKLEDIPTFDSTDSYIVHERLLDKVESEQQRLGRFAKSIYDSLQENQITRVIFLARQGSPFQPLIEGYISAMDGTHPHYAHVSTHPLGFTGYANPSNYEGSDTFKEMCNIFGVGITENVLLVDHMVESGNAFSSVKAFAKQFDQDSNYFWLDYCSFATWDNISFSYKRTDTSFSSPHKFDSVSYRQAKEFCPLPPNETTDVSRRTVYARLSGVLWHIGFNAGAQQQVR